MLSRSWMWLGLVAGSTSALHLATATAPPATIATYIPAASLIFRRDDSCPANTFRCSEELGQRFSDICCQNGQTCALDADDQPACCPSGAVCTGTAPSEAPTGDATAPVSYVPNSYFAFPYAATTFSNDGSCTSAVDACEENYDRCVSYLEDGGQYGVTIVVPGGGGTTVEGGGQALGPSATEVCSSLSSRACGKLEKSDCGDYGNAASSNNLESWLAGIGAAIAMLNVLA
ncbi:hypothetical protein FSOLCH5_000456 [Fusarium solani]|uniref:Gpi-anchored protein n=1 Tax=Fusarium solani TaxID=169388 RepID=A0A9P9L689_FUSSL|nr:uncharacterized protein B0J15DRAFT_137730 [Fusarium solani]KAH7274669.1 hypothetical protein B0J15DRAFT_137730 [Fusarium solani]KAJ3470381.1 hypothetical protein MRS44_000480 [Fusarium solani]